jgi:hypothetical protein
MFLARTNCFTTRVKSCGVKYILSIKECRIADRSTSRKLSNIHKLSKQSQVNLLMCLLKKKAFSKAR